ncbi:MAG: hypothetical protein ACPGZQ_06765, partial [Flavobacteriaceae bacterium]
MKTKLFTMIAALSLSMGVAAQNSVSVDASAAWEGYANWFDPASGAYVSGSVWGVADLKTTIDLAAGTITLQPNFNTYADNPSDPYWVDQTTGLGAKLFEGNTLLNDNSLAGVELTFSGNIDETTLDSEYDAIAFIKAGVDYGNLRSVTAPLTGSNFEITMAPESTDVIIQYGFAIIGLNANPDNEAALGSVVV